MVLAFVLVNNEKVSKKKPEVKDATKKMQEATKNRIQDRLLKNNKYSRPGIELQKVKDVVVHYTGNPGTNAIANRNYFNNLPRTNRLQQKEVYASSHYIIGLDGKIIRCIPENEISYASNSRNYDTLSIECCHPDSSGEFTKATYDSLVWLVSQICKYYELDKDEIIRHYDVNGKICPKFFVDNPASWELFRQDVINYGKAY
jgi:N-acetylmuramoyl-L-alanine amidase CwlA